MVFHIANDSDTKQTIHYHIYIPEYLHEHQNKPLWGSGITEQLTEGVDECQIHQQCLKLLKIVLRGR